MRRCRSVRTAIVGGAALVGFAVPATAHAAKDWAVVHENGTLVRGSRVAGTTRTGPGSYVVTFADRVAGCGYVANPGDAATGVVADSAVAAVARHAGDPHGVFLETYNETAHALADEPYHVAVYCAPSARFAVVGRGGVLSRGSHALSARRLAKGEYGIHFDSDVSRCAFTASIGSTDTTPRFVPGEIAVAPGRRPHNVFVTTFSAGGRRVSSPFHLAAACGRVPTRAVVKRDGSLVRGRDVSSAAHLATGAYEVIFTHDVSACAYTATIGTAAAGFSRMALTVTTATRLGNPNGAFISIHNLAGAAVDHAFHIVTRC
jgi:hypothetical protein